MIAHEDYVGAIELLDGLGYYEKSGEMRRLCYDKLRELQDAYHSIHLSGANAYGT